jgi:hypothetical protein
MKTRIILLSTMVLMFFSLFTACKKSSTTVSTPPVVVGQPVSDASPLAGTVKGTMLSGKTYTMSDNITINVGDTLLLQPGVTLKVGAGLTILVKGALISLGTKDKPNFIIPTAALVKNDAVGAPTATDPAYSGAWTGINCEASCTLLELKWTHVNYTGAVFSSAFFPSGKKAGDNSFGIMFQNTNGDFIMEDSWMYGCIDDAVRISTGRIHLMRNTFEKCGATGGDVLNAKSGTVGDMAYNLFVGTATNGTKASNKGGATVQTNVNMYNNTYISGGYRQMDPTGRGGSINYEEGAKGKAYNNLMVNCRTGVRICNNPLADIANISYGYNYSYGDSLRVCNMIYPVMPSNSITVPQPTDIPTPNSTIFPAAKYSQAYLYTVVGAACPNILTPYDGSSFVKVGDPKFKNFSLPLTGISRLSDVSATNLYDFRLQSSSPALGKGTSNPALIAPLAAVQVTNPKFKPTEITLPGNDMGCYQSNGMGNQH